MIRQGSQKVSHALATKRNGINIQADEWGVGVPILSKFDDSIVSNGVVLKNQFSNGPIEVQALLENSHAFYLQLCLR